MTEIDYALAWNFIEPADKPRQLGSGETSRPAMIPGSSAEPDNSSPSQTHAPTTETKSPSADPAFYSTTSKPP
jgi:hypothetical protein